MSKKAIGSGLIILGLIVGLLFLFADSLGIGGSPGIGWIQLTGLAIGIVIAIIGVWQIVRKP